MRRRGRQGWPRWVMGVVAGSIIFAASSLLIGMMASASTRISTGTAVVAGLPTLSTPTAHVNLLPTSTPCIPVLCAPKGTPAPSQSPTPPPPLCLLCGAPSPSGGGPSPTGSTGPVVPGPTASGPGGPQPTSSAGSSVPGAPVGGGPGGSGGNPGAAVASAPAVGGSNASLTIAPPPAVQLTTPASGLTFGKAPFLWPLFVALDVLAVGAVAAVLRKTWSKPVGD